MSKQETSIFETKCWKVVLAEEQTYLGACIVVLKRSPCGDLADVTVEEVTDFLDVVKVFETAIRKAFGATMFNWACLMNDAYQEPDPKPQVHWKVYPRYRRTVELAGEIFEDPNFGHHYILLADRNRVVTKETEKKIVTEIQAHLPL